MIPFDSMMTLPDSY